MKIRLADLHNARDIILSTSGIEVFEASFVSGDQAALDLYFAKKKKFSDEQIDNISRFCISYFGNDQYSEKLDIFLGKLKKNLGTKNFNEFLKKNGASFTLKAAYHGAINNIDLLDTFGVNMEAPIASNGMTAVHVAIMYGQTALVEHLARKAPVALTQADTNYYTPLLLAAAYGKKDMVDILLRQKSVNKSATVMKDGKSCNYTALLALPPLQTKEDSNIVRMDATLSEASSNYAKAALGEETKAFDLLVRSAIALQNFLLNSIYTKQTYTKQKFMLDSKLAQVTAARDVAHGDGKKLLILESIQIGREIQEIEQKHQTLLFQKELSLMYLLNISSILLELPEPIANLFEFLEKGYIELGKDDELVRTYSNAYSYYRDRGQTRDDFLDKSLKVVSKSQNLDNKTKGPFYFNLAISKQNTNFSEAIKYFNEAEKYLPGDIDVILKKYFIYRQIGNVVSLAFELKKIPEGNLKTALKLHAFTDNPAELMMQLQNPEFAEFRQIQSHDQHNVYDSFVYEIQLIELGWNMQTGILRDVCLKHLMDYPLDAQSILSKALLSLYRIGADEAALELLNIAHESHLDIMSSSHFDVALLYTEFLVYENNGLTDQATQTIAKLNNYYDSLPETTTLIQRMVSSTNYIKFINHANKGEYGQAAQYIKYLDLDERAIYEIFLSTISKKSEPVPQEQILEVKDTSKAKEDASLKQLAEVDNLQEEAAAAVEPSAAPILHKLPEHIAHFVSMVDTGQLDKDLLPAQLAESYFRYKKYEQKFANTEVVYTGRLEWDIGPDKYSHRADDNDSAHKLGGVPHYYIGIENSLLASLEPLEKKAFCNALDQARMARAHDQSGAKAFDNLIELKIMGHYGNIRLFTDSIYDDGNGNYFALLKTRGTHKDVEQARVPNGHIQILDGSSKAVTQAQQVKSAKSYISDPQDYYHDFVSHLDPASLDQAIFLAGDGWADQTS